MRIEIIADDFTGANDIGIQLRKYGLKVTSVINSSKKIETDVKVVSSETRNKNESYAYSKVKELFRQIKKSGYDKFYKKIDSTLRGNIAVELQAITEELDSCEKIAVVIGFPKTGRKIIDGKHYIGNIPLQNTEFKDDPIHPMEDNDISKLINGKIIRLNEIRNNLFETLKQTDEKILIFDTETDSDLEKIAKTLVKLKQDKHVVGSSGIMEYLLKYWKYEKERVLIIAGSCNEINLRQIDLFVQENKKKLSILEYDILSEEKINIKDLKKDILLRSIRKKEEMNKTLKNYNSNMISDNISEIAKKIIKKENIKNIIICGGEISLKVLEKLNIDFLNIDREIDTGIALGSFDEYKIITKPGGFGKKNFYKIAYEELKNADTIK